MHFRVNLNASYVLSHYSLCSKVQLVIVFNIGEMLWTNQCWCPIVPVHKFSSTSLYYYIDMYTIIWYYNDGIILYDNKYLWYTTLWTFFQICKICLNSTFVGFPFYILYPCCICNFAEPMLIAFLIGINQPSHLQIVIINWMQRHLLNEPLQLLPILVATLSSSAPDMLAFLPH